MGIRLEIIDHDKEFSLSKVTPVIVNDLNLEDQDDLNRLDSLIFTNYTEDSLEILPSCDCGETKGTYRHGQTCKQCGTDCLTVTERPLEALLWIRAPNGVDSLFNPHVWIMLSRTFTVSKVNVLEWLVNPRYHIPEGKEPLPILKLKEMKHPRGFNYFLRNFDAIMKLLIDDRVFKISKNEDREKIKQFIKENSSKFFPKYLPIPSKMVFVTEPSAMGMYCDTSITPAVNAIRTISGMENSIVPLNQKTKEVRTFQVISKLSQYYDSFYKESLGPKEGWFRKHVYGTRSHFSFRTVITSITEPHAYDEVYLPWSPTIMAYKLHIVSKLLKRGYSPNESIRLIYESTLKYNLIIDEILRELIAESDCDGEIGLPLIVQRNPSLTRGSAMALRGTRVKTDPNDNTLSISVLSISAANADFDGDALNILPIPDKKTWRRIKRLEPHLYSFETNKPRSLANYLALPSQIAITLSNWAYEKV